jgi:hypothetical protein
MHCEEGKQCFYMTKHDYDEICYMYKKDPYGSGDMTDVQYVITGIIASILGNWFAFACMAAIDSCGIGAGICATGWMVIPASLIMVGATLFSPIFFERLFWNCWFKNEFRGWVVFLVDSPLIYGMHSSDLTNPARGGCFCLLGYVVRFIFEYATGSGNVAKAAAGAGEAVAAKAEAQAEARVKGAVKAAANGTMACPECMGEAEAMAACKECKGKGTVASDSKIAGQAVGFAMNQAGV